MWLSVLGYTRNEVIGKWFGEFLHPGMMDKFRERFPIFKRDGKVHDVQFNMVKKDGSGIFVSFEGVIGRDKQGNFLRTYCTFKDITKEKKSP
ncbi:MAG: PAS domain S-box protein [Bacteroidales bacterium]|nr:PAS domain S-box protein [Bacteroidales bacterium]